jgi:enolase-phosphatase E1
MLKAAVIDIEGTVSPTAFVVGRLYPYAAERLAGWVGGHPGDPATVRAVSQVRDLIGDPGASEGTVVAALLDWLRSDQKITPLKTLQGLIWAQGFAAGELVAPFYPDAVPALRSWRDSGLFLHVYSSGSVAAQRAWFSHSSEGDLTFLISGHFDTENAGPKKVPASYRAIEAAIPQPAGEIVFLSDVAAELDAAREAGWHTVGVRRPGETSYDAGVGSHLEISSLAELDLSGDRPARA